LFPCISGAMMFVLVSSILSKLKDCDWFWAFNLL
jgi:hypothetical protein